MTQFLENLQRDMFSSTIESRRIPPPPPLFSQPVHHHHNPYYSQILLNNSFINHFSSARFPHPISDSFHFSTPKKRRTKVSNEKHIHD